MYEIFALRMYDHTHIAKHRGAEAVVSALSCFMLLKRLRRYSYKYVCIEIFNYNYLSSVGYCAEYVEGVKCQRVQRGIVEIAGCFAIFPRRRFAYRANVSSFPAAILLVCAQT